MTTTKKTVPVITLAGKEVGEMEMPVYEGDASMRLVAQVLLVQRARTRVRRAHTKDRAEVRGGGKKPWRQKGTGRARHGSSRSPIWVGGGITFGPRSRKTREVPVPADMVRKALAVAISEKENQGDLAVVKLDSLPTKTKEIAAMLPINTDGLLIIVADNNYTAVQRVMRNLPEVTVSRWTQVGAGAVLKAKRVWIDEAAWVEFWQNRLKVVAKGGK